MTEQEAIQSFLAEIALQGAVASGHYTIERDELAITALRAQAERENPKHMTIAQINSSISRLPSERDIGVCIVHGCEGDCVVIGNYRVAGNKPWGGGTIAGDWKTSLRDIGEALRGIATVTPIIPIAHEPKGADR